MYLQSDSLRYWRCQRLAICAFVACFRRVSTVTRHPLTRYVRTSSEANLEKLSTSAIWAHENMINLSANALAQNVGASVPHRNNEGIARKDALPQSDDDLRNQDPLESLMRKDVSVAKSNGVHLHALGPLDPTASQGFNQVQRTSSDGSFAGVWQQPLVPDSKSDQNGKMIRRRSIKSHVVSAARTDVQKSVLREGSAVLMRMKGRLPKTLQSVSSDGTVTTASESQQMNVGSSQSTELHPSAQVLPNGQVRVLVRTERAPASYLGKMELGTTENQADFIAELSPQVPQTAPTVVPITPVPAAAIVTTAPPPAPSDSGQGSTFFSSIGSVVLLIVLLSIVAVCSYVLGQRSLTRDRSNTFFQPLDSRQSFVGYRARAASRGRGVHEGTDDDESSVSESPYPPSPRKGVEEADVFEVGDRVKITKETRLKGKTATVLDPCWRKSNGCTLVQVKMDFKDEKGEVKSFKQADLEFLNIFQVGDRVKVVKQTRLKGKTATVLDPCWKKGNGYTLVQVRMDEKDVKGDIKSFTQADLEPIVPAIYVSTEA